MEMTNWGLKSGVLLAEVSAKGSEVSLYLLCVFH
jgi:hypothetical protein